MNEYRLEIPEGIVEIKEEEYIGREDITSIKFPSSLKTINKRAFARCKNIRVVELPRGIEYIASEAFLSVEAIFFVPHSIKRIDEAAFTGRSRIYLESNEGEFNGFYQEETIYDYPDSFYRGPSMGTTTEIRRFFTGSCRTIFGASYQDFLDGVEKYAK